jgi:AcrR family transcriptional regulator
MVKKRKKRAPAAAQPGGGPRQGGFQLLWGQKRRGILGRKPALTLDAVIRAATEVVQAEGLGALTMSRVASRLRVSTMALYRHVAKKEDLLDIVIDSAFGTPPASGSGDWRVEVTQWARACVAMFQERPWLLELVIRRAPIGPNWLAWFNALLQALSYSRLAPGEVLAAAALVDGHARTAAEISLAAKAAWAEKFSRVLATVGGDPRYPALGLLLANGGFAPSTGDASSLFEFGLARILDGIEAHCRARR